MQNQWEPWACLPATRFHPGGWETVMSEVCCLCPVYSIISLGLLSLLHKDRMLKMEAGFSVLFWQSRTFCLDLIQRVWRCDVRGGVACVEVWVSSNIPYGHCHLQSQVVMWAARSSCKYQWGFTCLPGIHILLCGPVPKRPWTGTSLWPGDWGSLLQNFLQL